MSDLSTTDDLFFARTGMDKHAVEQKVTETLSGCDDGELYFEYSQAESLSYDDSRIRSAAFDTAQGFGLRAIVGETTGFAHSTTMTEASISRAAETVNAVKSGHGGTLADPPSGTNRALYTGDNPLPLISVRNQSQNSRSH